MGVAVAIPLAALPSQVVTVTLGGQQCRIQVYQKATGLYLDLFVGDVPIVLAALCVNATPLVQDTYHGFIGDLGWGDTQGESDPDYTGLEDRFVLFWAQ